MVNPDWSLDSLHSFNIILGRIWKVFLGFLSNGFGTKGFGIWVREGLRKGNFGKMGGGWVCEVRGEWNERTKSEMKKGL